MTGQMGQGILAHLARHEVLPIGATKYRTGPEIVLKSKDLIFHRTGPDIDDIRAHRPPHFSTGRQSTAWLLPLKVVGT